METLAKPIEPYADQDPVLRTMLVDYTKCEGIYKPSLFWNCLNDMHLGLLKRYGFTQFKQTLNNHYFNWMVTPRHHLFLDALKSFRQRGGSLIKVSLEALRYRLHNAYYCNMTNPENALTLMTWPQRLVYTIYLLMLDTVANSESEGVHLVTESMYPSEPLLGTPIFLRKNNRIISQDISNSILELATIKHSLLHPETIRTIAEIGAGYGRFIYAAKNVSFGERYIIIDIPPALYISQRYISELFPGEKIFSYRSFQEYSEVASEFEQSRFAFLMPHQLELLPDFSIDLFVNISSLQEMTFAQINHYYELITKKARFFYTKQWLDWTNAEDQQHVLLKDYPVPKKWKPLYSGTPLTHSKFFEKLFAV